MRKSDGTLLDPWTFGDAGPAAGGYIDGLTISNDGWKGIRDDVFNAWFKGPTDTAWKMCFTPTSLPSGDVDDHSNGGPRSFALAVAPSDHTKWYGCYNARLYKSTDTCNSWTRIGNSAGLIPDGVLMQTNNGPQPHNAGDNLVIDPNNPLAFLFGTQANGIFGSIDGGTTIVANTSLPTNGTNAGWQWPSKVACDPTSTQSGGVRQRWAAVAQGTGVYMSTTGPTGTFSAMTGGPLYVWSLVFDNSGYLWACEYNGPVWRWDATNGWVNLTSANGAPSSMTMVAIRPDVSVVPGTSGHIYVYDAGNGVSWSNNGGVTWHSKITGTTTGHYFRRNTFCTNTPWVAKGNNLPPPGGGALKFDPSQTNKLYIGCGIGVFSCNPPTSQSPALDTQYFNWYEECAGQKEIVSQWALIPPGGTALLSCEDRPIWRLETFGVHPKGPYSPRKTSLYDSARKIDYYVNHCFSLDYADDNTQIIYAFINFSAETGQTAGAYCGVSTDGGKTWGTFPTTPPLGNIGGSLAAGNTGNVIMVPSNNSQPVYTKDGGSTWAVLPFPGLPAAGSESGFGSAWFNHEHIITRDKAGGNFYIYNYGPKANPSLAGVYKSTNGDTWTLVSNNGAGGKFDIYTDGASSFLQAVPNNAGHLFYSSGAAAPAEPALYRSTNSGAIFAAVTSPGSFTSVTAMGFGKAAPGQTYPAVYMAGKYTGNDYLGNAYSLKKGLWATFDNFATVELIAAYPANNLDTPYVVTGHPDKFGWGLIGFQGSGFYYFKPNYTLAITPS